MARLTYAISLFTIFLAAAACGSKSSSNPDAPVIQTTDAPPPIDGMPDALVCTAPDMQCVTGTCTNTNTDEQNCGTCGNVCKGGAYCKAQPDGCTCTGDFVGTNVDANPFDQHQVQNLGQANLHIGVAPLTGGTQLNALLFVSVGLPQVDHDYTLKSGLSFSQPNVFAAYNAQLGGTVPTADAYYEVTAGTLRFSTVACDDNGFEYKGTITGATFSGATISGMNVEVDPNGCTFDVASLTFDITVAAPPACTP